MSDSSDCNEIFGDESEEEDEATLQAQRLAPGDPQPDYVKTMEFNKFKVDEKVDVHDKYGYIYVHTYKPFYFPGEIVRGSIILDLFNTLPKDNKKVTLKFMGREVVGKYQDKVCRQLMKQQNNLISSMRNKKSGKQSSEIGESFHNQKLTNTYDNSQPKINN